MPRPILDELNIHAAIRDEIASHEQGTVREVQAAVAKYPVVVVGMSMNPFPKKARRALDNAGVPYQYMEYGSYFNFWRQRNALKLWTGWPTMPLIFVKGMLVGGADNLVKLIDSGELKKMLA
jgi:monothiol glutaredoxin